MKLRVSIRRNRAMTLLEAVVVTFLLSMLAIVLLPALISSPHHGGQYVNCVNNLKQVGLAFRIWEGDNNDKYPMAVSVTNGGAMEAAAQGNPMTLFQVMSNELNTPLILVCPQDKHRQAAANFNSTLTSANVSYFINVDASEVCPQEIMSGDDNLEIGGVPIKPGLQKIWTNTPVAWSSGRHKFCGNIGLADGSVQSENNSTLRYWLRSTNSTPIRLAIP